MAMSDNYMEHNWKIAVGLLRETRATLAEREARITSLQTELNHEMGKGDLLREELGEREAEIERLKKENYLTGEGPSHLVPRVRLDRVTKERDEARAALATARAEALEDFIGSLFEECQPNNGDLFSRVDDRIRALASDTKGSRRGQNG
jgi:chromosome segregation ATPase